MEEIEDFKFHIIDRFTFNYCVFYILAYLIKA